MCGCDCVLIRLIKVLRYSAKKITRKLRRKTRIPGVNDSEENIRATLAFIRPHKNVIKYELLPYHRFGQSKYGYLGQKYELEDPFAAGLDPRTAASHHRRVVRPQRLVPSFRG